MTNIPASANRVRFIPFQKREKREQLSFLPGSPKAPENGATDGETDRECEGVEFGEPPSGLLQGVAVGVNFGVTKVDGVAAMMPRSFSNFAKPKVTENVHVELRLECCNAGVPGVVLARLLLTVLMRLPCMLRRTNAMYKYLEILRVNAHRLTYSHLDVRLVVSHGCITVLFVYVYT